MDTHGFQSPDILDGGNAACRSDLVTRCLAQSPEPVEICPLHHPFFVNVGAQKSAAIWLELANNVFGRIVRRLAPSFHNDMAAFRVQRNQNLARIDRGVEGTQKVGIRTIGAKCGCTHDDLIYPEIHKPPRLFGSSHSASDANSSARRDPFDDVFICAGADSGIEIDYLYDRKRCELIEHFLWATALQRLFTALHKLHDLAVLE